MGIISRIGGRSCIIYIYYVHLCGKRKRNRLGIIVNFKWRLAGESCCVSVDGLCQPTKLIRIPVGYVRKKPGTMEKHDASISFWGK